MLKLPDVKELESLSKESSEVINKNITRTELILKKLMRNIEAFKFIEQENKDLRRALVENQDVIKREIYDKLRKMSLNIEKKQREAEKRYKRLLKQHESHKLDLKKQLAMEKGKNALYLRKHKELTVAFAKVAEENQRLKSIHKRLVFRMNELEEKSLANKKELDRRAEVIKTEFEKKMKQMAKQMLNKEVEYKAKIEALSQDLEKYYEDLKSSRKKYYDREKELKEKINQVLS